MTVGVSKPESVEVQKRRLRTALRQARMDADMTQKAAAGQLFWSVSKIVRIEQGIVPVTPTDVRAMLHIYEVTDSAEIDSMVDLAKRAREDKGWTPYSDVLSPESLDLFGNEPAARVIYKYEPSVVPGLFQSQDYARALLRAVGNSDRQINRRLEVRSQRQQLLESQQRPELNFILGETALVRPAGSAEVMREQIAHLRELAEIPDINIWVLPFSAGANRGMGSAFTVLQFGDPLLLDLLYLEGPEGESVSREETDKINDHLELFVELQEMASKYGTFEDHLDRILRERYPDREPIS